MGKLKIELNDIQNIRDLLQEAYKLADEQIVQSQNEINKLSSATNLHEEAMDAKAKYAKSINDYLSIKDKAIAKKLDIAKLLSDILNHNGDVKSAIDNGSAMKNMSINFDDIRKIVDDSLNEQEKTKTIQLNKK
jgi:predicted  nucleic acid-binding Zn-ribbon protein